MVKIETIKKCRNCKSDILMGQKFCMECGRKQDVPIRTEEEILGMIERVKEDMKAGDIELPQIISYMVATFVLSWCLSNSGDEELLKFLRVGKERKDKDKL